MAAGKMVLVVEDDDELRRLYRQALVIAGYAVKEARGGFEALQHLDNHRPDVVLLDLLMPGVDGFTVRNELAAQAHTKDIPIVVITGSTDDLRWLGVRRFPTA
jgi:CheY-like chemotaxis protein